MNYNGEGVHALVCAVEDLSNSNLIFVDRKLKPVLKCLAFYPEFRSVLSKCSQGFDYEAEKSLRKTRRQRRFQTSQKSQNARCARVEYARRI